VSQILACQKNGLPHTYQFPWKNFTDLLKTRSREIPAHPAFIFRDVDTGDRSVTSYADLDRETAAIAGTLNQKYGISQGDRVSLALPNCVEIPLITLALFRLGATSVPLDLKRDTPDRKQFKVQDSDSKLICTFPELVSEEQAILPDTRVVSTDELKGETSHAKSSEPEWSGSQTDEGHTNVVLYTSGTTGVPKGACLTRQSLTSNADGIIQWLGFDNADRLSLVLPLHHVNSTVFSLTMLMVGGTLILNSRYSLSQFWPVIEEEEVTATSIVPTIMHDLNGSDTEPATARNHLKKVMIGSAPVPSGAACRFVDRFGIPLTQGYGTTEVSLRVTGLSPDLKPDTYRYLLEENSIGSELANCNVAIHGDPTEGELGEILVRGPVVADGYLNQSSATLESFTDEWFRTGDIGYWRLIEGERYYFIHGRAKEIIIKGGVNISPIAVENALVESVDEISAAYVVGLPSERWGEDICAAVVVDGNTGDAARIIQTIYTMAQAGDISGLSSFEAPSKIVDVHPDDLPKTSTGKVQRAALKDRLIQRLSA